MALDLARISGICLDVDGTISDTDNAWTNRLSQVLHPLRFLFKGHNPASFARWLVMTGGSPANALYHWLDRMSLDDTIAGLYEKFSRRRKSRRSSFLLMDHALDFLELAASRYPVAIVSSRDDESTRQFIDQFELLGYFKAVVTSQTCKHTKPYADPVLFAAQWMGVAPDRCVMVGDTTVDILAGRAAGAQTIGVLCGFGTRRELEKAGADLIVKDLMELKKVIEGKN
jgi:HAD superfamily hydrolase (TIGR01509 family)